MRMWKEYEPGMIIVTLIKPLALMAALALAAAGASAESRKVNTYDEFVSLVKGKTLTRPLIKLQVTTDGRIQGRGARWDVEGNWYWKNGYFCRDLIWGGDDLGYNCQEVRSRGNRIRFTSDRGSGQSAEFALN